MFFWISQFETVFFLSSRHLNFLTSLSTDGSGFQEPMKPGMAHQRVSTETLGSREGLMRFLKARTVGAGICILGEIKSIKMSFHYIACNSLANSRLKLISLRPKSAFF